MAASSMAMPALIAHVDEKANSGVDVTANFTQVRTSFNAMLETVTGHSHTGTDSPMVYGGVTGWDTEELLLGILTGAFGRRGL